MKNRKRIFNLIIGCFLILACFSCEDENHIDQYKVNVEALKTLPDNFYAHRRGRVYHNTKNYSVWYNLNSIGKVSNIFKIQDFNNIDLEIENVIEKYNIDTVACIEIAKIFVNLSSKYKFGHINIDRKEKISFSYRNDLREQYVIAFNSKVENEYLNRREFEKLSNGWFEYKE